MATFNDNLPNDDGLPGDDGAPAALRDELRKRYGPRGEAGDELSKLDARVLAEARLQFAARPQPAVIASIGRRSVLWRIGAAVAAAAAIVALVVSLPTFFADNESSTLRDPVAVLPQAPALVAGDVNGDGRVDILDAYVLQRQIEALATADPRWDLNGDGKIDTSDVKTVASSAVRLSGGPRL